MSELLCPNFQPLVYSFQWDREESLSPIGLSAEIEVSPRVRQAVRDLLRFGGYKPSGRGRPASETLFKALQEGRFPYIHPVVDFFNLLSLEFGIPISVLDRDSLVGTWSFRVGRVAESYIFNPSGQEMDLKGLLLLVDENGPVGSPVKDSQRTKISVSTSNFFVVIWGSSELHQELEELGRRVESWALTHGVQLQTR